MALDGWRNEEKGAGWMGAGEGGENGWIEEGGARMLEATWTRITPRLLDIWPRAGK